LSPVRLYSFTSWRETRYSLVLKSGKPPGWCRRVRELCLSQGFHTQIVAISTIISRPRMYLKCFDEIQNWVPYTKTRKNYYLSTSVNITFLGAVSKFAGAQFVRFLSVGAFKSRVYSVLIKNERTFYQRIFFLSDNYQPFRELWKIATSMVWCVHRRNGAGRGYWEHFFVNCALINNKNLAVNGMEKCIVNVVYRLHAKY
jgi:hypothetical protein